MKGTILALVAMIVFSPGDMYGQNGSLYGSVHDQETGEELIGANVLVEGTKLGASTDLDGSFRITGVPPGTYRVTVSMVSYTRKVIEGISVAAGETVKLDVALSAETIETDEVVVEARLVRDSDAALLKLRQRAASVSDAISAEAISRTEASSAAEVMSRVTGVTIVDQKFVYVRGLGDRYNNTLLNGVVVPSANPDRNAVALDVIPSRFIQNVVTEKTFTPDRPGEYTGGGVNIETKSYPEMFGMSLNVGASYNSAATFADGFLTYPGGSTDWLGIDDGTRAVPDPLSDPAVRVPDLGSSFTNREDALELDRLSKSFNGFMSPRTKTGTMNSSVGLSVGDRVDNTPVGTIGYVGNLTYSNSSSHYGDGIAAQYQLTGKVSEVDNLTVLSDLDDQRSIEEALVGAMGSVSLKPDALHSITLSANYTRASENEARYLVGPVPRDFSAQTRFETRVLRWTERHLLNLQARGSHVLPALAGTRVEWNVSNTSMRQEEPDLRLFSNDFTIVSTSSGPDTLYSLRPSNYSEPTRYYRDLEDAIQAFDLWASVPLAELVGVRGFVKFGGAVNLKDREFRERRFRYFKTSNIRYEGDPIAYFSASSVGLIDSTNSFYLFGNYINDDTDPANSYDGDQRVTAAFGMVDLALNSWLRLIGGVRYEHSTVNVVSMDPNQERGEMDDQDILPSASVVFSATEAMNFRLAYGRTLARPTFRELAPYPSFDFVGDFIFIGNPDLKRTLIDNYDIRWEWFPRPGELIAVSAFAKSFRDPIERAIVSNNNQGQFQNVARASVMGAEFDVRKRLDFISQVLTPFIVGVNVSLIQSEVDIPAKELSVLRELDPGAPSTRELQGQSPYIVNLDVVYENLSSGTTIDLLYNVFGKRLSRVSLGGTPNVYEQPRPVIDLAVTQRIWENLSTKIFARNLLDSPFKESHSYKGQEYVIRENRFGRTFGLTLMLSM